MNTGDDAPRAKSARPWPVWTTRLLAFGVGLAGALVAHYVLYRIGLASTPFIYVSF